MKATVDAIRPASLNNKQICDDIIRKCSPSRRLESRELAKILIHPHIRELLRAHDEIGQIYEHNNKHFEESSKKLESFPIRKSCYLFSSEILSNKMPVEAVRIVGLRRVENQPLGFTVEVNPQKLLVVARILSGGTIDKQGLLHPGDVILEINGNRVDTPEALQIEVARAKDNLTLKIAPQVDENVGEYSISNYHAIEKPGKKLTCFMRALFNYNPLEDSLLPCKDIGLPFKSGDILQILSVKDPNWWQAKNLYDQSERIGLIPSQELEERRKAFVVPEADFAHKIGICGTRVRYIRLSERFGNKFCATILCANNPLCASNNGDIQ